jgi:hypothetical protein
MLMLDRSEEKYFQMAVRFVVSLPPGEAETQMMMQDTVASELPKPFSSPSVNEDRMPSKRYSLTRREGRPGVEERMELKPFRGRGRARVDKRSPAPSPSRNSPVIGLSGTHPSRRSPVIGSSGTQPSRSSPVIGSSGTQPSRSSPVIGSPGMQPSRISPVIGSPGMQPSRSSPVIGSSGPHPSSGGVGVDLGFLDSPVNAYEYSNSDASSSNNRPDSPNKISSEKQELVQTLYKVI